MEEPIKHVKSFDRIEDVVLIEGNPNPKDLKQATSRKSGIQPLFFYSPTTQTLYVRLRQVEELVGIIDNSGCVAVYKLEDVPGLLTMVENKR